MIPLLQLIGDLRTEVPAPGDYSFLGNLFTRLPQEMPTGLTRYVGYEGPRVGEQQPYFLGVEVEKIERIPTGMMALALTEDTIQILQPTADGVRCSWEGGLSWDWRERSARESCPVVGEFSAAVPDNWLAGGTPIPFRLVSNSYTDLSGGGPSDEILIADYDPGWPSTFPEFRDWLKEVLGDAALSIEHVGSTSIPDMPAKPIIDVLVEVSSVREAKQLFLSAINEPSWEYWWYHGKMTCIKRDGFLGMRTHHVHLMPRGEQSAAILAFRDWLRSHPDDAQRYADLKRRLADEYRHDRETYTDAKSAFVKEIVTKAKQ